MRRLWPGFRLGWIPIALALLAHVPGRRVYAANETQHGRPGWQFLCAGLLGDLLYVGPVLLLAFVIPLLAGAIARRRWPRTRAASLATSTATGASALLALVIVVLGWMFSVGAIESKLERGLYPTYLETRVALASSTFVIGQLPTLLLDRYWKTSLLVLVTAGLVLLAYRRAAERSLRSLTDVAGFTIGALTLFLVSAALLQRGRIFFPRTGGYFETRSPLETIALGKLPFRDHAALTDGMRQLFATREYSLEEKRAGLRELGYPQACAARLEAFEHGEPCSTPHPLARPLDRLPASRASAAALLAELEGLSAELFEDRTPPVIVWQIAMESFRADDIHALQPLAPPELTPVMSRLYEDREHAVAFRRAFQGGFRTAQSLSALFCGVGSLPFNVAVARDLGHVPLRCLPDVLSDGGFESRAFYASDLAYDSMLEFFRYHGVEATQAADLPQGLPHGSWRGVSDRALYEQVLLHAEARNAVEVRAQYNFVLTLSGHSPFLQPTDMPPEVAARVAQACSKSPWARADDCSRLGVIAYADHALGEFLARLAASPLASRSVVVLSADHATSEIGLWPGASEEKGRAHVPYVMYVTPARVAASPDPAAVTARLVALHDLAATEVISLSDSPSLVTALVSATNGMLAIPAAWRFHTYGGQATSPDFEFAARPAARIWGTDSAAFVFSADAEGTVVAQENKNRSFSNVSELEAMNPSLRGPAALLSSFVKGYLLRCEGRVRLRSSVPVR